MRSLNIVAAVAALLAAAPAAPRMQGRAGIAARYSADRGIGKDPAVLFTEDFEGEGLGKWQDRKGAPRLVTERPNGGRQSILMEMNKGKDTGAHLIRWFPPGADKVHVRFYVRFSADYQYNHHFVTLLATDRNNRWSPFGKAGQKPDGTWFCTGMEPWFAWGRNPPPGEVTFYSYFLDMEIDPKMNRYWGNSFFPPGPGRGTAAGPNRVIPPLDRWQCWEFMVQANSAPDKADGKQAMWVDGRLVGEFTGIRWRKGTDLKVNCLWLQHYGYDESDPTRNATKSYQAVWFDDVVVASEYIGPKSPDR